MVNAFAKRLIRFSVVALLALLATPASAALRASVDRNPVALDESFNLTLRSDESRSADPDLSVLNKDFEVLGQSKSSSIQIVNGSTTQSTQWQISLMAKRGGQLQIPAIAAGNQTSQPIDITVSNAAPTQVSRSEGDLFIEVSATPREAYVQQQIVFTVQLYRAVDLGSGSTLSDPAFPKMDAVVQRLDEDHEFQATRNGREYAVIERRYAIFPQKNGSFTSDPVVFDGSVVEATQGGGFFSFSPFRQTTRHLRLRSKSIAFTIKPIPPGFDATDWLPASSLQLQEQWSETPPSFTVGEPITRTLTISAVGLSASQLPTLDGGKIEGMKLYPDQPSLKDNKDGTGIRAVRQQKIAMIPTRSGDLTLPPVDVRWWNIKEDKAESVRLPQRQIHVLPGNGVQQTPPTTAGVPLPSVGSAARSNETSESPTALPLTATFSSSKAWWWPWLTLMFAVGWSVTALLWWRRARAARTAIASATRQREMSLRQIERQIKHSCMADDALGAKTHLLDWAQHRWPADAPASLTALARRCDGSLTKALSELDRALYAQGDHSWQGAPFWRQFETLQKIESDKTSDRRDPLEPLYKSA